MVFAWRASTNEHGTTSDPVFYTQTRSSVMTILGIGIALYPTFGRAAPGATYWAQNLATLGVMCAVVAVPPYIPVVAESTGLRVKQH